jgi:hypothetical protein
MNVYTVPLMKYLAVSTRNPASKRVYRTIHCYHTLFLLYFVFFFRLFLVHFRVPQVMVVYKWRVNHVDYMKVEL